MSSRLKKLAFQTVAALFAVCFMTTAGHADLTVKQKTTTSGLMGILNTEIKTVTYLKGDKKCDETETKMTNKIMKFMGGGKPIKTTSIINLADGIMINVDHKNKTCTETPLSQIGDMASSLMGGAMSGDNEEMGDQEMFDTSRVTMNPPEITVDKTGKSEKIAGYKCEQYLITMVIKGEDEESGQEFDMTVDMDLWIAKDVPGFEEYQAFNQKMVEEMGIDASSSFGGSMSSMLAMYGVDSEELSKRAADLEGFPMRTIMKMKGTGGQFDEMQADQPEDSEESEEADAQSKMASKMLKGLFGGGSDDDDDEGGDGDDGYFITVRTEVKDISTKSVKDGKFNCPNKYDVEKIDYGSE